MPATMEALVVTEPNVLEVREVPVPEPGPNQVLIEIAAVATMTPSTTRRPPKPMRATIA